MLCADKKWTPKYIPVGVILKKPVSFVSNFRYAFTNYMNLDFLFGNVNKLPPQGHDAFYLFNNNY